jgi:hypothetical protein
MLTSPIPHTVFLCLLEYHRQHLIDDLQLFINYVQLYDLSIPLVVRPAVMRTNYLFVVRTVISSSLLQALSSEISATPFNMAHQGINDRDFQTTWTQVR